MRLSLKVTCQLILYVYYKEAPPCDRDAMPGTSRKLWESVLAPHTPKGRSNGTGCGRRVQVTRRAHAHALDHLQPMREYDTLPRFAASFRFMSPRQGRSAPAKGQP